MYQNIKVKSLLEEPKRKHQRQEMEHSLESESEEETRIQLEEQAKEHFQNSDTVVTSKDTTLGGGLNLAFIVDRTKVPGGRNHETKT